jgi:hypothetical protein
MKLKIFLSSRNNDVLIFPKGKTLTEIRKSIAKKIEEIRFLGKEIFEVSINEDFGGDASMDSYNKCLVEVQNSDFVIVLYNGYAGWAPNGIDMGICHAELDAALNVSTKKVAVIDMKDFFNLVENTEMDTKRNKAFVKYLTDLNLFNNPIKLAKAQRNNNGFENELLHSIENLIRKHLDDRIKMSNLYYNIAGNNRISLNWKKLKYSDRNNQIKKILSSLLTGTGSFDDFTYRTYSIPDNMSVEDAKSFTGRPFLNDQDIIEVPVGDKKTKFGPLHFIGVYGNATEIQVKSLIGYPDITVIKEDFGIYVWEQNTHIQLIFLTDCRTPEAVKSKFLLFNNWCISRGEVENIKKRANARYVIMRAINEAKIITDK